MHACVHACVRPYMRAYTHACVRACVRANMNITKPFKINVAKALRGPEQRRTRKKIGAKMAPKPRLEIAPPNRLHALTKSCFQGRFLAPESGPLFGPSFEFCALPCPQPHAFAHHIFPRPFSPLSIHLDLHALGPRSAHAGRALPLGAGACAPWPRGGLCVGVYN